MREKIAPCSSSSQADTARDVLSDNLTNSQKIAASRPECHRNGFSWFSTLRSLTWPVRQHKRKRTSSPLHISFLTRTYCLTEALPRHGCPARRGAEQPRAGSPGAGNAGRGIYANWRKIGVGLACETLGRSTQPCFQGGITLLGVIHFTKPLRAESHSICANLRLVRKTGGGSVAP